MKKLTTLILIVTSINATIMATNEKKFKEIKINKTSQVINVSADSLWKIVREFDNVGEFFSSLDHTEGIGTPEFDGATCSERVCQVNIKGYSEVYERLTMFNEEKKELAYEFIGGGPSFLLFAGNHWKVEEVSPNQSILVMNATMHLKRFAGFLFGGKLERIIERELPISLDELKLYAETGQLSKAKKERNEELKRKRSKNAA